MQHITVPPEPNTRLTILTRSIVHRRPEHKTETDSRPRAIPATEAPAGLDLIAQFLMSNTKASGVALAILDETGLHCRASAGEAPQLGTAIRMENTISGQCIQNGAFFHCADTLEKCPNALPARSILLLPILWGRHARGLVALFSRQPDAFSPASIAIARSATALAAITLNACSPQLDCPIDGQVLEADNLEPAALAPAALAPAPAEHTAPRLPAAAESEDVLEESGPPHPGKIVYGLPCAKCGAYFSTFEKKCPVCKTPK
jgi:hypothetical protein